MVWKPADQCLLDPTTQVRQGPTKLSTAIIGLFGCGLLASIGMNIHTFVTNNSQHRRVAVTAHTVIGLIAFYLYWAFYTQCRPTTGFLIALAFTITLYVVTFVILLIWVLDSVQNAFDRSKDPPSYCEGMLDNCWPTKSIEVVDGIAHADVPSSGVVQNGLFTEPPLAPGASSGDCLKNWRCDLVKHGRTPEGRYYVDLPSDGVTTTLAQQPTGVELNRLYEIRVMCDPINSQDMRLRIRINYRTAVALGALDSINVFDFNKHPIPKHPFSVIIRTVLWPSADAGSHPELIVEAIKINPPWDGQTRTIRILAITAQPVADQ